jgi:Mn2+/Fe2+ NRAMP family transporter
MLDLFDPINIVAGFLCVIALILFVLIINSHIEVIDGFIGLLSVLALMCFALILIYRKPS